MSDDSPSTPSSDGTGGGSKLADEFASLPHGVLFRRATTWDLATVEPTEAERETLAAGVSDRVARYLVWRRGLMYLALAAGAVTAIFALVATIREISQASEAQQGGGILSLLVLLTFASKMLLIALVFVCFRRWTDAAWTGRRLRVGWAIALLTPLVLALVPLAAILVGDVQPSQVAARDLVSLVFGMALFITAMPALLTLFPGVLRASMVVKTAFPGRGVSPTVGAAVIPIYLVFLLVVLTPLQQLVSSFLFFLGIGLFIAGPIAYARNAVPLFRPMTAEAASVGVNKVRVSMRWFQVPGMFLFAVALLSKRVFGAHVFGFEDNSIIGFWKLLDMLSSFVLMVSTYTIVAADGLIQAMAEGEERAEEARATSAWQDDSEPLAETAAQLGPIGLLSRDAAKEAAADDNDA